MINVNLQKQLFNPIKAGGVLYKTQDGVMLICMIHRPKVDDWCIPKGHVESGESLQETARREVAEETGFDGKVEKYLGKQEYEWSDDTRFFWCINHVFLMKYTGTSNIVAIPKEVDQVVWLPLQEAIQKATYDDTQAVLKQLA